MRRNIVILTPGFPKDEDDTTCLPAIQQFILSLKNSDPDLKVRVISLNYPFLRTQYRWHGIDVVSIGGKNGRKLAAARTWYRTYKVLKSLHREERIDAILSLWITDAALVGNYFAKRYHIKHMTWIIGQDAKPGNRHVARIEPKATQLIAMSDFIRDTFETNYGIRPAHVVTNGVNEAVFPPLNPGNRHLDLLGAGSLIPLKNYSLFIEIVAELKNEFPDIRACIVGEGPEREQLQDLIHARDLTEQVRLMGSMPHERVLQLMNESKVFLHTSHYEGNSTVLMEALCAGCFVVSTQSLSETPVTHLEVHAGKDRLLAAVRNILQVNSLRHERVIFNTMDRSARTILDLLLQQ